MGARRSQRFSCGNHVVHAVPCSVSRSQWGEVHRMSFGRVVRLGDEAGDSSTSCHGDSRGAFLPDVSFGTPGPLISLAWSREIVFNRKR